MNIKEISEKLGLSFLNEAEPSKEVEGGYCGDLLSFVMSHAKCGDCWFTVMGNVNAVAVAVLSDCAAPGYPKDGARRNLQKASYCQGTDFPPKAFFRLHTATSPPP